MLKAGRAITDLCLKNSDLISHKTRYFSNSQITKFNNIRR